MPKSIGTIEELSDLLDQLKKYDIESMRRQIGALSQAMADIMEMLSEQGPKHAEAIANALSGVQLQMPEFKAPDVNVTLASPTGPKRLSIEVTKFGVNGRAEKYEITVG